MALFRPFVHVTAERKPSVEIIQEDRANVDSVILLGVGSINGIDLSLEIEGEPTRMKITRIEVPSRMEESHSGDSLDSSPRSSSSRNDYSEDKTDIDNLSEKIFFGLVNSTAFIDHAALEIFGRLYKRLRNNKTKSTMFFFILSYQF